MSESKVPYNYQRLLKRREWLEKRAEIIAKFPRCQRCNLKNGKLDVHHRSYEYGRSPWDYPDGVFMVLCVRCHREADEEREREEEDAKNYKRFGPQYELARKDQRPSERELRKLATHEKKFKAWLTREEITPAGGDWDHQVYPLWYLWNHFSAQYLTEKDSSDDPQGWLFDDASIPRTHT